MNPSSENAVSMSTWVSQETAIGQSEQVFRSSELPG